MIDADKQAVIDSVLADVAAGKIHDHNGRS